MSSSESPVPPVPASSANIIYGLIGFLTLILLLRSTVLTRIRAASLASKKAKSPYFTAHLQKAQYEELAEMYSPEDEHGLKILTSALVRRAMVDVQRIWQIREEKPSLQGLVRTGVLGEDMMEKITEAEKELEVEVQELITEADMYKPGWGKTIFQEATTFMQAQAQQLQQAAQQQQQRAAPATSPDAATSPTSNASSPAGELTREELEERARKAAQDLLEEEEKEKMRAEQRAKSAKAGKAKAAPKKK